METELTPIGAAVLRWAKQAGASDSLIASMRQRMSNGESAPRSKLEEARRQAEQFNATKGFLDKDPYYPSYDCPKCRNRGAVAEVDKDGELVKYECECMKKRQYLRNIKRSGLSELLTRYTLANWQCREPWQRSLLEMVQHYAERPNGWFCLSGTPGTGKTHLCTALCGLLLEKGLSVRYMLWKDVSTKAKAVINDEEAYGEIVEPLKSVRVLYIDDFWKTGRAVDRATGKRVPAAPTVGDVNFAFDIINARYADSRLITILSTEMTLGEMLNVDEATGSRIVERTKEGGYQSLAGKRNWRLM